MFFIHVLNSNLNSNFDFSIMNDR